MCIRVSLRKTTQPLLVPPPSKMGVSNPRPPLATRGPKQPIQTIKKTREKKDKENIPRAIELVTGSHLVHVPT